VGRPLKWLDKGEGILSEDFDISLSTSWEFSELHFWIDDLTSFIMSYAHN
jgi:hypothetical protein